MRKALAAVMALLALVAAPAAAEVRSIKICDAKTLTASNANLYGLGNGVTDCTYTDISFGHFFSWQASCAETTGDDMSVSFDWVANSGGSSTYGIPLNTAGSAMAQLRTAWTTETTYTTLQSLQPPVSPMGTIRITNNNADADIICTVILNIGD